MQLKVHDVLGRRLATLYEGHAGAVRCEVRFDVSHLPSGVYICQLQAEAFAQARCLLGGEL